MPSWMARHSLARLSDEAGLSLPLSQWPLPSAAVRSALNALPTDLPETLARARDDVLADLDQADRPLLTVRAKTRREAPVGFDDDYVPGSSLTLRSGSIAAADATSFTRWRATFCNATRGLSAGFRSRTSPWCASKNRRSVTAIAVRKSRSDAHWESGTSSRRV